MKFRKNGAQQIPFSYVSARRGDDWLEGGYTNWDALAMVNTRHPLKQLVVISPTGNVHLVGSGDRLSAGERDWFTFDGTNWKRID